METRDFDRIRFVTRHFHDLQGLRHLVPVGLITLSAAACFTPAPLLFLGAVPFLGALLLMLGARRYYGNSCGQAEPRQAAPQPTAEALCVSIYNSAGPAPWLASSPSPISTLQRPLLVIGLAPTLFLLFQNLIAPPWVTFPSGMTLPRPVMWPAFGELGAFPALLLYALYGSLFLSIWLLRERRLSQSYHLGLGALLLGLSALGTAPPWIAPLLCGAATVLAGLLDHCQLVRALGPAVQESEEDV
jgi:hypothetical protein